MTAAAPRGDVPVGEGTRAALPGEQRTGSPDLDERVTVSVILRRAAPLDPPGAGARPLRRDQFAVRHGALPGDIEQVREFAVAAGLRVAAADAVRRTVAVEGTLGAVADAFGTAVSLVSYQGGTFRAPVRPAQVPAALAAVVEGVFGLDTRPVAAPRVRLARPEDAVGSFSALDLARLYGFPADLDGSGQTIAIVELGGGFTAADLDSYFSGLGLAAPSVQAQPVDGAGNSPTGDPDSADLEVMLDIEVAGAIAPGASILVYFAPNTNQGFIDALTMAVLAADQPCCVSVSWGNSEDAWDAASRSTMDGFLQDAAALGIPVCTAAGDNGSSDGVPDGLQHADFPSSSPFALACGGTTLNSADGTSIDSEVVWNDDDGATGGGVSDVFPRPAWQAGAGVPPTVNPGGFAGRGLPDVAADAAPSTGYAIRVDGSDLVAGGTSAVAPLWAGLIARLSQYLGDGGTGFLNPVLYGDPLSQQTFRDITSGNNGSYPAGPGWDPCTGWGSPGGAALLQVLAIWNFAQWQTGP
jgi:kumamolisin